jgi:hypothetical protein
MVLVGVTDILGIALGISRTIKSRRGSYHGDSLEPATMRP